MTVTELNLYVVECGLVKIIEGFSSESSVIEGKIK